MTDHTDNVVQFPISPERQVPTIEQIKSNIDDHKQNEVDQATELLSNMLLESISVAGFPLDASSDSTAKHLCFCMEALRSLVCRFYNVDHEFHPLAEHLFVVDDQQDAVTFLPSKFNITVVEPKPDDTARPE